MSLSLRITTLAATVLITAATFAGGTVALASASAAPRPQSRIALTTIQGRSTGFGATLAAAERDAKVEMLGNYYGCVAPFTIVSYGQNSGGTWWADMVASCQGYN